MRPVCSEVTRRWNGIFQEDRKRFSAETHGCDSTKGAFRRIAVSKTNGYASTASELRPLSLTVLALNPLGIILDTTDEISELLEGAACLYTQVGFKGRVPRMYLPGSKEVGPQTTEGVESQNVEGDLLNMVTLLYVST